MSVKFCKGDVFAFSRPVDLAHGCNCRGFMGAGIAAEFKKRWPDMYELYKSFCEKVPSENIIGDLFDYDEPNTGGTLASRRIYDLFTQIDGGACADAFAIVSSVERMLMLAMDERPGSEIAMPLVGSGIGGLSESVAEAAIILGHELARQEQPYDKKIRGKRKLDVTLFVVDEYIEGLDPALSA